MPGTSGGSSSMRDFLARASSSMKNLTTTMTSSSIIIGGEATTCDGTPSDSRLPMPEITRPFPVIENPPRCMITSVFDRSVRLTSTRNGKVDLTSNRGDREQFLLIPVANISKDGKCIAPVKYYYLKSHKFNRYLTFDSTTGKVGTVKIITESIKGQSSNNEEEKEEMNNNNQGCDEKVDWLATAKAKAEMAFFANDTTPTVPNKAQLGDAEQWLLKKSPYGGHFLVSATNESLHIVNYQSISYMGEGRRVTSNTVALKKKGENAIAESWDIEFVTGELCFISSSPPSSSPPPPLSSVSSELEASPPSCGLVAEMKQIRCDLMGNLSFTNDKRGWEVWRFVEMDGGKVRIVSWMHSQFCIVCNHEGRVFTIGVGKAEEGCDEWTVEKAPDGYIGVVIKSVACARRILSRTDGEGGGILLSTLQEFEGGCCVWQLDAAHSQVYTLTSLYHKRSIGPFPYVSEQSDQLVLQMMDEEGTVRLYHKSKGMYLRSSVEGEVECGGTKNNYHDTEEASAQLWKMEQTRDGGYTFSSKKHGGLLSFSNDEVSPKLCTESVITDTKREIWSVNPLLPRAISSAKIKTVAIVTGLEVGMTVAMPFLMAGMLAVVPAEATLAASIMAAGLTSAEAIASVGAIGVTAAIVFREDNGTIGIESEHEDDEKDYTNRPLCAWKSWR